MDKDHDQVTTGNSRGINNNKLRKIFSKGLWYRENRTTDCRKATESRVIGIKS